MVRGRNLRRKVTHMATSSSLDRVAASMYVSEIRDLIDSLRYRINLLQQARDAWLVHEGVASTQASADPNLFDQQAFADALNAGVQQQMSIFDAFEALL